MGIYGMGAEFYNDGFAAAAAVIGTEKQHYKDVLKMDRSATTAAEG